MDDKNNDDDPNACECSVKLNALNIVFINKSCGCWLDTPFMQKCQGTKVHKRHVHNVNVQNNNKMKVEI